VVGKSLPWEGAPTQGYTRLRSPLPKKNLVLRLSKEGKRRNLCKMGALRSIMTLASGGDESPASRWLAGSNTSVNRAREFQAH